MRVRLPVPSPRTRCRAPALLVCATTALALSACSYPENRRAATEERFAELLRQSAAPRGPARIVPPLRTEDPPVPAPYIERGGLRFRTTELDRGPAPVAGDAVDLNFPDADIKDFARAVLGDILGLTYAIDPRIEGTISLETRSPVPRGQVLPLVEQVLAMHGAALAPLPGGYQIVRADAASRTATAGPGATVRAIPLQHIEAAKAASMVQTILPAGAVVAPLERPNALLVAGTRAQADLVEATVLGVDVDGLRGRSLALRPLRYAAPDAVAEELSSIFGGEGGGAEVRFIPVQRLNAVVIVTGAPETLDRMLGWVDRFDREGGGDQPELYVYPVQNGRATDLAQTLGQLLGAPPVRPGAGAVAPGFADRRMAAATRLPERRALAGRPGAGGLAGTGTTGSADGSAGTEGSAVSPPLLERGDDAEPAGPELVVDRPNLKVIADEKRNALVINATRREFRRVENVLRQLDVQPLQVLIEATIAEVALTDDLQYGLQWFFRSGRFQAILSRAGNGAVNPSFPGFNTVFDNADARVVLTALSNITDVRVVSSPQLMVLTNETAVLHVGDSVPIPVQQATSVLTADAVVVNSIQYRDTGVTLQVTPRVNQGGLVTLDVDQDVSDAELTISSGIDAPTIRRRRIASTVTVADGETLGLGGLIRDAATESNDGIPVLSTLPIIGPLFGTRGSNIGRTELLVLLTPRVVQNPQDARAITEEMRSRLTSGNRPHLEPPVPARPIRLGPPGP